jgi:hypothetical protein
VFLLKLVPGDKKARLILAVAALAGISWLVHFAWTMFRHLNTVTMSPATVGLALNSPDDETGIASLSLTNMQPGANAYIGLTVANTGSADFWLTMSSTASGDAGLAGDLRVGIAVAPAGACDASGYAAGTVLRRQTQGLANLSIGAQPLAASDSESLCFHIQLPLRLPSSIQGNSAQATLNFTALE